MKKITNWLFYRPFHPSVNGFVSDGYWNEMLEYIKEHLQPY